MIDILDYSSFIEFVGRYNHEAKQLIGMTVSSIPTPKTLEMFKSDIKENLLNYFYKDALLEKFSEKEVEDMKKYFSSNYNLLLAETSFSKSFISSEWYYNLQVQTNGDLEQTAIIAGYLKSVEQLLYAVVLALSDKYRISFYTKGIGRKKVRLSKENYYTLNITAGSLINEIAGKLLQNPEKEERLTEYLKDYIQATRTAYFHKDNIYDWNKVENIRTKTYCTYFLILSNFIIEKGKIMQNEEQIKKKIV